MASIASICNRGYQRAFDNEISTAKGLSNEISKRECNLHLTID